MHERDDLMGRILERRVYRESIGDESTGEEFTSEQSRETRETFDGSIETVESVNAKVLACGHVHLPEGVLARCDACSKEAGQTVYVCERCGVTCPVTGQSLCLRCTKLGPDGRRYSPKGYKHAKRMGLFQTNQETSPAFLSQTVCAPDRSRSLLKRLLEWW
jgi:hypothetical protein